MSRLGGRVRRLEGPGRGRCPACRLRPDTLFVPTGFVNAADYLAGHRPPPKDPGPEARPCPVCGFRPKVASLLEIIVHNREEIAAVDAMRKAEGDEEDEERP